MRKITALFVLFFVAPAMGESFLKASDFPKTFEDLSFVARQEFLYDSYAPYEIEYDEDGVCISGCAYSGITIKEDMAAVDEATEEMAKLIQNSSGNGSVEFPEPGKPSASSPSKPTSPSKPNQPTDFPGQQSGGSTNVIVSQDWCKNGLSTSLPLRYPVDMTNFKYKISSDFGFRVSSPNGSKFHPAIDIGTPSGTPVYATADGTVSTVQNQNNNGGAGLFISIKHSNNLITQYLHLSKALVKVGDEVKACQQIALSGNSGKNKSGGAYDAHLDYRIRFAGNTNKYVDILCPCKSGDRKTNQSSNTNISSMTCEHSLFHNRYKFKPYNPNSDVIKRSLWRVRYGHCMTNVNDLLPDEVR